MRKSEREIKSREEIEAVVAKATVMYLGLVDGNLPYVVPLNYGYKDNRLYFHSAKEGRKLDVLRRNNNVCFTMSADQVFVEAEKGCNWAMKYRSVMGTGKAYFVEDVPEKVAALKLIMAHYSDKEYDFSEKEAGTVAVVRIDIDSLSGKKARY